MQTQDIISFVIPGAPVPKDRPRFSMHNGIPRTHTSTHTQRFEGLVHATADLAMKLREPLQGPVVVSIRYVFQVPPSWSKTRRTAALKGQILHTTRPDIDNLVKATLDGINGVCMLDDSQVVELSATKTYGECPCTQVALFSLQVAE